MHDADSDGHITKQNLAKATEVKALYLKISSQMQRSDMRIRRRVSGKYGRKMVGTNLIPPALPMGYWTVLLS